MLLTGSLLTTVLHYSSLNALYGHINIRILNTVLLFLQLVLRGFLATWG